MLKKACVFVLVMCVIGITGCAWGSVAIDEEHFPDASFRAYVFNKFDLNGDGVLSDEEIDNAKLLTLYKDLGYYDEIHYVTSLKGIEYLTALTYLNCENNGLRDLDVSRNTVLAYLYCSGNRLTDLNLSNNSALKGLYCNGNLLSSLSMGGCHELKDLFCSDNQLSSLGISSNSALERLKCNSNKLQVLDVSGNKALCYLEAYNFMEDAFARFYLNPQQAKIEDINASLGISGLRLLQNREGDYYVNLNDYVPNATTGVKSVQVWRLRRFYLSESSQGIVYIARKNGDPYDDYTGSWWNYIKSNLDNGEGVSVNFSHSLTPDADGENDKLGGCYVSLFTGSYNEPTTNAPTPPAYLDLKVEAIGTDTIICGFDSEHYFDSKGNALTEESIADYSYGNNGKQGLVADGNSRLIIRVQSDKPGSAMFALSRDSGVRLERLTDRTSIQYKEPVDAVKIRDGLYQVSAVVVAPEGFLEGKNFPSDTFKVIVSFTGEDQEIQKDKNYRWYNLPALKYVTADMKTLKLKIEAAPVILIPGKVNAHGLFLASWGDANHTFGRNNNSGIWRELLDIGFKKEHITLFDYNSTKSVKDNTSGLYDCLQNMFETYAKEGIVCTKADIVAHGLGGLLVRQFLDESDKSDNSNWSPISYRQGMIHKVVNIAVPHRGTPLANVILGDMSVINSDLSLGKDRLAYRAMKYLPAFCSEFLATPAQWKDLAVGSDVVNLPFPANVPMHFIYGDVKHSLDTLETMKDLLFLAFNVCKLIKALEPNIAKYQDLTDYLEDLDILKEFAHLQGKYLDSSQLLEALAMLDNEVLRVMAEQKDIIMGIIKNVMENFGVPFAEMASNSPIFTGLMQIGETALGGAAGLLTTPIDLYFVIQRLLFSGQAHDTFVPKSSAIAAFPEYSTGFPVEPGIFDLWHFKHGEICHQAGVAEFVGYLLKAAPMSDFAVLRESVQLPGATSLPATVKADSIGDSNVDIDIDFENFRVKNFDLSIRKSTSENFGDGMTALKFIANATTLTSNDAKLVIQKDGLDRIFPMFTNDGYTFEAIIVFQSGDEGALTAYCYAPSDKGNLYVSDTVEFSYLDTFTDEEPDNTPPQINVGELPCAVTGQSYATQLTASGTRPITWTHTGRLPAGLTLSESGLISGIPTKAGKSSFTVKATNEYGHDTAKFTLQTFEPVSISTASLKDATTGKNYSVTFKAKGTRQITWTAEGLPDGLTINAKTGRISGKPSVYGTFSVKITGTNDAGSTEKSYQLTVKGIPPKIAGNLARAELNESYSSGLRLTAGSSPVVWSVEGTLPDGLTFDSETGIISGTPTEAGRFKLKITASNDGGITKPRTVTLNVKGTPPRITTAKLPDAETGQTYSATLTATGSTPITWTAENLPSGLYLDGDMIKGIPSESGRAKITVYAENPVKTVKKSLTLKINPAVSSLPDTAKNNNEAENVSGHAQSITSLPGHESITGNGALSLANDYVVVAVLPVISCDESGIYDFSVALSDDATIGAELVYVANSDTPSDDDNIAEFYDDTGKETSAVPESRQITISIWLNAGTIYRPSIAVKK